MLAWLVVIALFSEQALARNPQKLEIAETNLEDNGILLLEPVEIDPLTTAQIENKEVDNAIDKSSPPENVPPTHYTVPSPRHTPPPYAPPPFPYAPPPSSYAPFYQSEHKPEARSVELVSFSWIIVAGLLAFAFVNTILLGATLIFTIGIFSWILGLLQIIAPSIAFALTQGLAAFMAPFLAVGALAG